MQSGHIHDKYCTWRGFFHNQVVSHTSNYLGLGIQLMESPFLYLLLWKFLDKKTCPPLEWSCQYTTLLGLNHYIFIIHLDALRVEKVEESTQRTIFYQRVLVWQIGVWNLPKVIWGIKWHCQKNLLFMRTPFGTILHRYLLKGTRVPYAKFMPFKCWPSYFYHCNSRGCDVSPHHSWKRG